MRFHLSTREAAERSPLRHLVLSRPTAFRLPPEVTDFTIQDAYAALVTTKNETSRSSRTLFKPCATVALLSSSPIVQTISSGWRIIRDSARLYPEGWHGQEAASRRQWRNWMQFLTEYHAFCSPPEATLARALTTQDRTRCSSPCPFHGAARCSNTSGVCIEFITARMWFECSTTSMRRFRCLLEWMRSG